MQFCDHITKISFYNIWDLNTAASLKIISITFLKTHCATFVTVALKIYVLPALAHSVSAWHKDSLNNICDCSIKDSLYKFCDYSNTASLKHIWIRKRTCATEALKIYVLPALAHSVSAWHNPLAQHKRIAPWKIQSVFSIIDSANLFVGKRGPREKGFLCGIPIISWC